MPQAQERYDPSTDPKQLRLSAKKLRELISLINHDQTPTVSKLLREHVMVCDSLADSIEAVTRRLALKVHDRVNGALRTPPQYRRPTNP